MTITAECDPATLRVKQLCPGKPLTKREILRIAHARAGVAAGAYERTDVIEETSRKLVHALENRP